ncbi:MAG: 50S ribosomal protein L29 [Patescibacteria group bacterium]|nr:50S ribosomal protein L29 [Patescibacteria group bacterium]
MKRKDFETYKNKSVMEIDKDLFDLREKLANLELDLFQGKVKNIREIRKLKRTIAQLLTLKRSKTNNTS